MAMTEGLGVTPVYNLDNKNDDGFFGGGGSLIFFLFFLLAWGGNGFGGFGGANGAVGQINNDFMYSNLSNQLGRIQDQNTFANNTLQQGLCTTTYELANKIGGVQNAIEACCCATQKELLINRYEAEKNTCAITNAIHADGEATRALLTQNTIQDLRDKLQAAEFGLSQATQTASIVQQIRPFPSPAYITCSPYSSPYDCGTC